MPVWGPNKVAASADDAYEDGLGNFNSALTVTYAYSDPVPLGGDYRCMGHRWQNLTIPNGATINSAILRLRLNWLTDDDANLKIYAHLHASAPDFVANPNIISVAQRPRTIAFTPWVQNDIMVPAGVGYYAAPDIKDVIKEIVDQGGWASGNDLVLLLIANADVHKQLACWTWNQAPNGTLSAELTINWELGNNPPTAPTGQQVDGQSSPIGANCTSDLTPGFTAIYNDPDAGDQANAIQIQVGTASGLSDMWDSGWLADSTVTPNRCTAKTYAGASLLPGTSYWWRCRFRDNGGLEGAWSAWQQFDICEEGRTGSGTEVTGVGSSGSGCEPGGSLPKRLAFVCPRKDPRREPAYRFPICSP